MELLKQSEYALASTSIGASKWYILRKHIIPNAMGPILVDVTLTVPRAIFSEATLGFLGLGLAAPKASLGTLVNDGLKGMPVGNYYQIIIPAIFISNMRWDKVSETEWTCKTYHKKDFKRETPSVTATFKIGANGKITCKQVINAMGDAPGNEMPKENGSYVWAADDGHGFKKPVVQ